MKWAFWVVGSAVVFFVLVVFYISFVHSPRFNGAVFCESVGGVCVDSFSCQEYFYDSDESYVRHYTARCSVETEICCIPGE